MKPKKKYLLKVYGGGNGCTLLKTYECDTLKEARTQKAQLHRYYPLFNFDIVSAEEPVIPLQH